MQQKRSTHIMTGKTTSWGTAFSNINPWDPKSEVFSIGSVIGSGRTTTLLPSTSPSTEPSSAAQPEHPDNALGAMRALDARCGKQSTTGSSPAPLKSRALPGPTPSSSASQSSKPETTASPSSGKKPTQK